MGNKWVFHDGQGGQNYEKKSSKKLGGKLTSGSGSKAQKGDVKLSTSQYEFLLELKTTTKESLSVKKEWLYKIRKAGLEQDRIPLLMFSFITMNGDVVNEEEWMLMPSSHFWEMCGLNKVFGRNM